jgi:phage tail-like protein
MTDQNTFVAVDSLVANEFHVELDGTALQGIFRISGLTPFKLDASGSPVNEPFLLSKMVQRDGNNPFNTWLRETTAARGADRPRRTVSVVAIDDGTETRRWTFSGAFISGVTYSAFDSASNEMVEENVTIAYDSVEETFPAS